MTRPLVLTCLIAVVEAIGGWLTGSLALLSDAGHMWTDVSALGLALLAAWFAAARPTASAPTATCGWRSSARW
jgi:cobalt-zinc-cadmium efflux system protein